MQIKEIIGVSRPSSVETPPLEDVVVLVDHTGVALGVERAFSARVRGVRDGGSGLIASRYVEIPLVGSYGEVSGVLYLTGARGMASLCRLERTNAVAGGSQFLVHNINNLLAVIDSGMRPLQHRSDGFVAGARLATIAGTLDWTLPLGITVRTEIASDLWGFNADPEELYFALLDLCQNSADAMPKGGTITIMAHNVEASADAPQEYVEIAVADDGNTPYFTTKAAGRGTGLGLPQVRRFAEGRGGSVTIESERDASTRVRLFLPRVPTFGRPDTIVSTEIA